jgi:hypothetical protein
MDRKRWAYVVIVAGIATILFSLWLLPLASRRARQGEPDCAGCRPPAGAMIRFELAGSREEVLSILGPADTPCGRCIRKMLDAENYADFGFMLSYSALNLGIVLFLALPILAGGGTGRAARTLVALGVAGAVLMLLGDAAENLGLLRLTGPAPDFGSALALLYPATRLKWGTLAVEALLLAGLYALSAFASPRLPGQLLTLLGIPYLLAGGFGLRAVLAGGTRGYGSFYQWLALAWLLSLLHAAVWLVTSRRPSAVRG